MKENYAKYLLDKTRDDYNLISKDFSRTRAVVWKETKFLFNDYLKDKDKMLDLGCGNGRYFLMTKDKDVEYIGIDNSSKLIEESRKNHPFAKFETADALELPFEDNYFNKVYGIAILHHIPSKELRLKFLNEASRVLKSDGFLIVTTWKFYRLKEYFLLFKYTILKILGISKLDFKDIFEPWGDTKIKRYYHWFSKRELENIVKKAGFKIKDSGIIENPKRNRRNIYIVAYK
jgi:tRNA (uracil-5-)-methyltransferase TRM9